MEPALRIEKDERHIRIVLNRPSTKNALNLETLEALGRALEDAQSAAAPVVVLTGAGDAFSSGGDIQDMAARRGKAVATYERLRAGLARLVALIVNHPKPVIARVDGDALGAGASLALACDFLIATERSRFGFPFVKVGLVPDTGSSWLLPHIVGIQQARALLLTGDPLAAPAASSLGLITQLVPDSKALDAAVDDWTRRLGALPPTAVADTKRLLWQNVHVPLASALLNEALVQGVRFTTEEHARAVDAFLTKRKRVNT